MDITPVYETTDMCKAATLCVFGGTLSHIKVTGRNGNMGVFCFSQVDQEIGDDVDYCRARVEPYAYQNQVKRLTGMVKNLIPKAK